MFCFEKSVFLLFKVLEVSFAHFDFFQHWLWNHNQLVSGSFFQTSHRGEHVKVRNVKAEQNPRSRRLPRAASPCPERQDRGETAPGPVSGGNAPRGKQQINI